MTSSSKVFILLGPPGAGKGSLSLMCTEQFGWVQLSTGNLCRDHIERKTALGLEMQELIAQGQLVPDEIIIGFVVDWLTSQKPLPKGILLDGTPRTVNQARILYDVMKTQCSAVEMVVVKLQIDAALLVDRIVNRLICSNKVCGQVYSLRAGSTSLPKVAMICDACDCALMRRSDDTVESLKQRLNVYYEHEQEIVDFYVDKGVEMITLNGAQNIADVFEDFKKIVLRNHDC